MPFATFPRSVSDEPSSHPRSLTPVLHGDLGFHITEPYLPYDVHEDGVARARREKIEEHWEIMFQNMGRAPTPCESSPFAPPLHPGWGFLGHTGSSRTSAGTGYLTPKSRSHSPCPSSRKLASSAKPSEYSPPSKPFGATLNLDFDMMQMDEDGTDADDERESTGVSRKLKYLSDEVEGLSRSGDHGDEEMQDAFADSDSIEKELSRVNLHILDSRLSDFVSKARATRRRKFEPLQASPRLTRSVAKRRKEFELIGI
ncbi:hypothetical protein F5876DRAFT_68134 [Lentinula aff. lateritia]|uniref:Uncharacterized protein n=1 Tax=Lentinula aff. lateritia TaxID=2804960 RepID=A0ACC1TRP8_9AGAR|nr:hypothetical protein F5876DRAFT_68134 [Lentinula aff. lateritia]